MDTEKFIEWVTREIKRRGLTQKEVAGDIVSRNQISMVLSGESQPGLLFFLAIRQAFHLTLDEVCAKAGIITDTVLESSTLDIITRKLTDLPPESITDVEQFIDFLRARQQAAEQDDQDLEKRLNTIGEPARRDLLDTAEIIQSQRKRKTENDKHPNNPPQPESAVQRSLFL